MVTAMVTRAMSLDTLITLAVMTGMGTAMAIRASTPAITMTTATTAMGTAMAIRVRR